MKQNKNTTEYRAYRKSGGGSGQSEELSATTRDQATIEARENNERGIRHELVPITSVAEYRGPVCTGAATAENGFEWI